MRIVLTILGTVSAVIGASIIYWAHGTGTFFVSPLKIAIYFVFPALVIAFGILVVVLPTRIATLLAVNGVAFATALVLFEGYHQVFVRNQPTIPVAAGSTDASPTDLPSHLCSTNLLRADASGKLVPLLAYAGEGFLPLSGPAGMTVRHRIADGSSVVPRRNDALGFNNPPGTWNKDHDVHIVGDSFAFGADVMPGEAVADKLRDAIPGLYNLGCGGNGPLSALAAIREFSRAKEPDTVLWLFYEGNDLTKDLPREREADVLASYLDPEHSQDLLARSDAIQERLSEHARALAAQAKPTANTTSPSPFSLKQIATLTGLRSVLGMSLEFHPDTLEMFEEVFLTADRDVEAWGGELVLVYLPAEVRFTSAAAGLDAGAYKAMVQRFAETNDIPFVDVARSLSALENPRDLYNGHFTVEGNAAVAEIVLRALDGGN